MRKIATSLMCLAVVGACAKHDPILPGERSAIFSSASVNVLNESLPQLPNEETGVNMAAPNCPYTQDAANTIRDGERKIFSGFATPNSVKSDQHPVCHGKYVYAGLTTGAVVKINPSTRTIVWIADVYRPSNLTGGASIVDITAPIIVTDNWVYAGGLGDAFCKINNSTGASKWCTNIGVGVPFLVFDNVSYVCATDGNLYAIRNSDGAVYWHTEVKRQSAPTYSNGIISVGKQKFDALTGKEI